MSPEISDQRPGLQKFFDNVWLLLILGVLIPTVSFTLWGWVELLLVQPAKLP